ncbi:DUF5675 family protein [Dyadobacter sp. CY343]|uniref:DUF5675 family protein n=1 Tax=Dyadobacter sp. CY343 TaxID=2907299 RepID=UPI001F18771D|nr:DUF5675 family protein [Dyadobacter sp. CY343]MCE7061248.1 DUF5675 family protein [Dyadobacter sp. CY343]
MEIKSTRRKKGKNTTLSTLVVDGKPYQYILEDVDRDLFETTPLEEISRIKVPARTAIPVGRYEVAITYSNRFKRQMIILIGVPGFAGIRAHSGNTHLHTEGCLIPGEKYGTESGDYIVGNSRVATDKLQSLVASVLAKGEKVYWTIEQKYDQ